MGVARRARARRAHRRAARRVQRSAARTGACRRSSRGGCAPLGYEPFVQTVRAALRHTGALRIDHVMGLFRLFWIPEGCTAEEGTYVRYPGTELLDIVALESVRAGAEIVGEDLGTVEDQVRAQLAERAVLSYRVVWFEREPPESFPAQALASVSTHDLPTIAGVWTGADLDGPAASRGRTRTRQGSPRIDVGSRN